MTGLTPLVSYPWSQHWEKNLAYNRFPVDTLTDQLSDLRPVRHRSHSDRTIEIIDYKTGGAKSQVSGFPSSERCPRSMPLTV